jgi:hypothetical protein
MPNNKKIAPPQTQFGIKGIPTQLRTSFAKACQQRGQKMNFVVQSLMEAFVAAVAEDQLGSLKITISRP